MLFVKSENSFADIPKWHTAVDVFKMLQIIFDPKIEKGFKKEDRESRLKPYNILLIGWLILENRKKIQNLRNKIYIDRKSICWTWKQQEKSFLSKNCIQIICLLMLWEVKRLTVGKGYKVEQENNNIRNATDLKLSFSSVITSWFTVSKQACFWLTMCSHLIGTLVLVRN